MMMNGDWKGVFCLVCSLKRDVWVCLLWTLCFSIGCSPYHRPECTWERMIRKIIWSVYLGLELEVWMGYVRWLGRGWLDMGGIQTGRVGWGNRYREDIEFRETTWEALDCENCWMKSRELSWGTRKGKHWRFFNVAAPVCWLNPSVLSVSNT